MPPEEKAPLETLAIEWVDEWVCAETFDNRQALRKAGWSWLVVPPGEDGHPSGLIEVATVDAKNFRDFEKFRHLLENKNDPWSEYVDPRELYERTDATNVPFWIHRRVEKWVEWNDKHGDRAHEAGVVSPDGMGTERSPAKKGGRKEPYLPRRCISTKRDGSRCWGWAASHEGDGRCRAHAPGAYLAQNQGHQIALARMKMIQAAPAMADVLEELATEAASEQVRLKAAESILDRSGVSTTSDINVNFGVKDERDPAQVVQDRLSELAGRLAAAKELEIRAVEKEETDMVEAEIVE